jgi:single-stranded-DNA-specific exonuclease
MISISGKKWEERKIDPKNIDKIKQDHDFSEILSKLIITRNFDDDEIYTISNQINISNVFLNNDDYKKSIEILVDTINKKEKTCILGDYDVDGSAATSLFIKFFDSIKHPYFYYIPDRVTDGYGASKKLFTKLILNKPKLIIMVDCGSTSVEAVNYLNENNIKSIIIDHHEINKPYPKANSIINPKKNTGYEKYDYFCATALTYFFLDILAKKIENRFNIKDFLIYVLLATVCDVMPLRKINRLIAIKALQEFKIINNDAFNQIYNLKNKKNKITINDLGFFIGPILNAGGRLGKSNYATELLSTTNKKLINVRSNELIILNEKRKEIENKILEDIDFHKIENENKSLIIIYNPNINEGLLGIIAARVKDYFNKPAIIITTSNNILKGSARSTFNFNIGRVMKNAVDENIIISGGGHNMAAGFVLKKNMLNNFKNYVNNFYNKLNIKNNEIFKYDAKISSMSFNKNFYDNIKKLEPFGNANIEPLFLFEGLKSIKTNIVNNKHISCIFKSKIGYSIQSISFNSINTKIGEYLLNYKKELNVIAQIKENFWNNKNTLQLTVKDLSIESNKT